MLRKAAAPGRMRGIGLELWAAALQHPPSGGRALREGLSAARALHSRERRLVREVLFTMVRRGSRHAWALGSDAPLDLWLAVLVEMGLPADEAAPWSAAPFRALDAAAERSLALPLLRRMSVWHGLPEPVVARWLRRWGEDGCAALLAASDARAPLTLRANRHRIDRDALAAALAAEGVATRPCGPGAPDGLHVVGEAQLTNLPAYRDGLFEVQDEGSQRLAGLVPEGARVLDLCAGAGGKALALAARGHAVLASDVRGGALRELDDRARRARLRIPTVRLPERGPLPPALAAFRADVVLVDAPCTGSGVLRRHPEHRWSLDEARIADRAALQREILAGAAALVPPGGSLIYGTCSLLDDENDDIVRHLCAQRPELQVDGEPLVTAPHLDGCDGFFGVRLVRSATLHSTSRSSAD